MLLLLSFVALRMIVYALAVLSPLAGILGVSMVVSTAACVVGFRIGANIWDQPLRREQMTGICRATAACGTGTSSLQALSTVRTEPSDHSPRGLKAAARSAPDIGHGRDRPHHNDHACILAKHAVRKTGCR